MPWKTCPRCEKPQPNVGPWNDAKVGAEYKELCGPCKAYLCLATPRRRASFAASCAPGASAIAGQPVTIEIVPPKDPRGETH